MNLRCGTGSNRVAVHRRLAKQSEREGGETTPAIRERAASPPSLLLSILSLSSNLAVPGFRFLQFLLPHSPLSLRPLLCSHGIIRPALSSHLVTASYPFAFLLRLVFHLHRWSSPLKPDWGATRPLTTNASYPKALVSSARRSDWLK